MCQIVSNQLEEVLSKDGQAKNQEKAQNWDTSHPNVQTRKVIKQSFLEEKEAYFREDALLAKKKAIRSLTVQKKKRSSKSAKTEWFILVN
jgi:hypothetical protein